MSDKDKIRGWNRRCMRVADKEASVPTGSVFRFLFGFDYRVHHNVHENVCAQVCAWVQRPYLISSPLRYCAAVKNSVKKNRKKNPSYGTIGVGSGSRTEAPERVAGVKAGARLKD